MTRENNIKVCKENREIVRNNGYLFEGRQVTFSHSLKEHQEVIVLSPEKIESIVMDKDKRFESSFCASKCCEFRITNGDSFSVKTDMVLNFANAVHPGGGYLSGANAQEEALCRQSTLYASISSKKASEMYRYNDSCNDPLDSDYMLISPCVEVFRDVDLNLLAEPYTTAVITAPAPDLKRKAAIVDKGILHAVMTNRIRQLLYSAAYYGYRSITLGAWGCGAFGHDPNDMAVYFREVLIEDKMYELFDSVTFAILDKTGTGDNYTAFTNVFSDVLERGFIGEPQKDEENQPMEINEIRLTSENLKKNMLKGTAALHYAECGAPGVPGEIMFLTETGNLYSTNIIYGMDIKTLKKGLPGIESILSGDKPDWENIYLGMGHHLLVKSTVYERFMSKYGENCYAEDIAWSWYEKMMEVITEINAEKEDEEETKHYFSECEVYIAQNKKFILSLGTGISAVSGFDDIADNLRGDALSFEISFGMNYDIDMYGCSILAFIKKYYPALYDKAKNRIRNDDTVYTIVCYDMS